MTYPGPVKRSDYIEWAKMALQGRLNLATSGVMHYPASQLPVRIEDIELSGPSWYGYAPLQEALASKCGVAPENVVAAAGTSMANFLAMATLLEPGDDVLVERPAYDPLVAIPAYLGANVIRFERRLEDGFRLDPAEIARVVTNRTRVIVITNMHNPTGVLVDSDSLREVGEIAREAGARVLVDEVYLEALFANPTPSAFHLGSEFITTSSLTKAYGLSGLRCGWVLADAELAERMWRLNDLFGNIPAHPAERLSVVALRNLDAIGARAIALLETNRPILNRFLDSRDDLELVRPRFGTVVAPKMKRGKVEDFCRLLREKYETSVVPGRFFEMPDHIRIGIGGETETLRIGLERLSAALDEVDK